MAKKPAIDDPSLAAFVDAEQARGRYTFTHSDAVRAGKRSDAALKAALWRLKRGDRIVSPRRGFHVVIPVEYREAGTPPASWFIDALMQYLKQPYYVGLLSAAAIHGAAHQQPMVFQVVTNRPTRPISVGRVRIQFNMSRAVKLTPVVDVPTDTGSMRVATPEATAFDLVRFAANAGYLNNVATVLSELSEKIDPVALTKLAKRYAIPEVQRLGYLLERIGANKLASPLEAWLKKRRYRAIPLAPWEPKGKEDADVTWRVIPNDNVEVDL